LGKRWKRTMTVAVCFNCGLMKEGAFTKCAECAALPEAEDDLVLSLMMTDHYFDVPELEKMGVSVREGNPPHLDPDSHAELLERIRSRNMVKKQKHSDEE